MVGIVDLIYTASFLALPTTRDRLVWNRQSLKYFIIGGAFESLGNSWSSMPDLRPGGAGAPLTATLPLWVVIGSKLFLNDVENITARIAIGAILVVLGTVAISLAKV